MLALARSRTDGWLQTHSGGEVLLRYVISDSANASLALRAENATHGDLVLLNVANSEVTCAEKIFRWLAMASLWNVELVAVIDDDTWIHTERLLADLQPYADEPFLFYGQFSWAQEWDERNMRHQGYANHGLGILQAADKYQRRHPVTAQARNGPFPLANGFMMVLGLYLAHAAGHSSAAAEMSKRLRHLEATGRRPRRVGKCDPAGDSALGYLIAHELPRDLNVKVVDVTSTARVHFWRNKATATALRSSLVLMHAAAQWVDHFQFATCNAADQHGVDRAPEFRCMPVLNHVSRCARPPHLGSSSRLCNREESYFATTFLNWTWCEGRGTFRTLPGLQLRNKSFCSAGEAAVLQSCQAGFERSDELWVRGSLLKA